MRILPKILLIFLTTLYSCGVYNFTGGSIPKDVKTISIQNFYNETGQGPANLSQIFTEKLKDQYLNRSNLSLVKDGGDWQLEGAITKYQTSSVSPKDNLTSASNRLTISVKVIFTNALNEKNGTDDPPRSFEDTFTFFDDYPQNKTLSDVENDKIEFILNQIVFDIFQRTASNW
ncbi:MAG: LPS assembly lipoprotein LptE [Cytophagaceae bacterium]|nr:LPS assembly lipoprotein LptE [Cytophagaceae bacterium]MDW8456430.1 LptE family protein [Cytophagaceae bacterium]